jgi:glycosyltransferase involved in cell wall biosynthesis
VSTLSTVSICIPTYNYGRYLSTALASALSQTTPPCEVIVSDNWSTDNTQEVVQAYAGSIRFVTPETQLSIGDHFRFAAEHARGDYVVLLSADDALHPRFIETVTPYLGKYTMISTGVFGCDSKMKPFRYSGLTYCFRRGGYPGQLFPYFMTGCGYTLSATAIERSWLIELPRLPVEASYALDWCVALVTSAYRPVAMLPIPRYYYRFHEANSTHSDPERGRRQLKAMLDWLACSNLLHGKYRRAVEKRREMMENESHRGSTETGIRQWAKEVISWLVCHAYRHPAYLR